MNEMTHSQMLYQDDAYLRECEARVVALRDGAVVLDRTVFYPLGGGQPGDTGVLCTNDEREIAVTDTRRDRESGEILHCCDTTGIGVGDSVTACIDWTCGTGTCACTPVCIC